MNRIIKECCSFVVGHFIDIIVSFVLTMIYAGILNKTKYNFEVVFILILTVVFFAASLFVLLYIRGSKIPDLKWNEEVTADLYELKIEEKNLLKFHRKSQFRPIRLNCVITKYGQYDWSDCEISSIRFSDNTLNSLSEFEYKGVDSSDTVQASITLSKNKKNLDQINNCKYKTMNYICRFHPNNDPHILEYQVEMKPQENFQKQLFAIIKRPVKKLTLKLVVNNSVLVENVCFEAETALGEKYTLSPKKELTVSSESDDGTSQIYTIVIKKPKMFCKYSISWENP